MAMEDVTCVPDDANCAGQAALPVGEARDAVDVAGFLASGRAFGPEGPVCRIDTHAASIFLTGRRAWKVKRPVALGYLDFTTVEQRRVALESELRLNRRTAPDLYLALHPITRTSDGMLSIGGEGEIVDWVLEMRRFPDGALLAEQVELGPLAPGLLAALVDRIHAFHAAAEIVDGEPASARLRHVIVGNADRFAAYAAHLDLHAAAEVLAMQRDRLDLLAPLLDRRGRHGRVRHCHGDLHLANIAMIEGAPVPFDCIEFDPELACIDVLYDLAFLIMDLWHRDHHDAANQVFNRYLDLSAEDEAGAPLMPLFLSVRAAVRAHVCAERASRTGTRDDTALAHDYLRLAGELLTPVAPRLVAIGGRSGTGKSTLALALAPAIGAPPGARILRTDVLRKRRAGVPPEARLPRNHYTPQSSREVYADLAATCETALRGGASVIADAAFLMLEERRGIEEAAAGRRVTFTGLWLEAGEAVRCARVAARERDASDADTAIVRLQTRRSCGPLERWHRLRASGPPEQVRASAERLLKPDAGCRG